MTSTARSCGEILLTACSFDGNFGAAARGPCFPFLTVLCLGSGAFLTWEDRDHGLRPCRVLAGALICEMRSSGSQCSACAERNSKWKDSYAIADTTQPLSPKYYRLNDATTLALSGEFTQYCIVDGRQGSNHRGFAASCVTPAGSLNRHSILALHVRNIDCWQHVPSAGSVRWKKQPIACGAASSGSCPQCLPHLNHCLIQMLLC